MVYIEGFDQLGHYTNLELQHKLHLKFNNINTFIEASLIKTYNLYKKNKKSNISYLDYRTLMLKELELHRNRKTNESPSFAKTNYSKFSDNSLFSDEESSISSLEI